MELGSGRWVRCRLSKDQGRKLRASRRLRIRTQAVGKGLPCSCLFGQFCPAVCHPQTITHQAPLSMGFSRQEYWRGCHVLLQRIASPGNPPTLGIKPASLISPELETSSLPPGKSHLLHTSSLLLLLLPGRSIVPDSLRPHGLQHARFPCPSPSPRAYSNSCPLSQ